MPLHLGHHLGIGELLDVHVDGLALGDVVRIPIGGGQAGQGGDFQEGRVDSLMSAPLRGAQGLRYGQVASHSKGKWDTRPLDRKILDGWRWGLGAARSARMSRSHLVEVGHP